MSAQAATFNLEYTFGTGEVLTAVIEGALQADMNTVLVTGTGAFAVDGIPGPTLPEFAALTDLSEATGASPVLTLDGSLMDLAACEDIAVCANAYGLSFGAVSSLGPIALLERSGAMILAERTDPARYSLTATAVPLPAPAVLLGAALAGLVVMRRCA